MTRAQVRRNAVKEETVHCFLKVNGLNSPLLPPPLQRPNPAH